MVNGLSTQVGSVGGLECDQLPIQALLVTDHLKELSHELQDVRLASAVRPMQEVAQRFLAAGIADRSLWRTQPHLHKDPVHHKDQETELLRIHLGPCLLWGSLARRW